MLRLPFLAILAALLISAQEPPASALQQPDPTRNKALNNALNSMKLQLLQKNRPTAASLKEAPAETASNACGHIRVIPANPDIDPSIKVPEPAPLPGKDKPHFTMQVHKGIPACQTPGR